MRQIVEIAEGNRDVASGVIDQNIKAAEGPGYIQMHYVCETWVPASRGAA